LLVRAPELGWSYGYHGQMTYSVFSHMTAPYITQWTKHLPRISYLSNIVYISLVFIRAALASIGQQSSQDEAG
jgi:hypothetical protein